MAPGTVTASMPFSGMLSWPRARNASALGHPLVRPLWMHYPGDPVAAPGRGAPQTALEALTEHVQARLTQPLHGHLQAR